MMDCEDDFFFEEDKMDYFYGHLDADAVEMPFFPPESARYYLSEDKLGMTLTAGSVTLKKNDSNLIGISIGGGGKYCPCLYVVQVFDNTAASQDGTLQSGDEITGVNTHNVKGKSKTEVAQLIQRSQGTVTIHYNKLHPDPKQGKSLDIVLKKVKHRLVESMSSSTADAFGLSRAILCNDALVKKLDDLDKAEEMYRALIDHAKLVFKAFFDLIQVFKKFGDIFCRIGVREIQQSANEAFNQFGEAHRSMEKYGIHMLKRLKPILGDLGTYLHKAIPDTRLTIKRYADVKFEYLSYCLKVKEMDDEEIQFAQMQEPLYRVETGNYEYRLILRCRQDARAAFARLRSDVLVKLELLDSKHVQHLTTQLTRLVSVLASYHTECQQLMHDKHWFPIELDLAGTTLYNPGNDNPYADDEEEEEEPTEDDDTLLDAVEASEGENNFLGADGNTNEDQLSNEALLSKMQGLALDDDACLVGDTTTLLQAQPSSINSGLPELQQSLGMIPAASNTLTFQPQNIGLNPLGTAQLSAHMMSNTMPMNSASSIQPAPSLVGLSNFTPGNVNQNTASLGSTANVNISPNPQMSMLSQQLLHSGEAGNQLDCFMSPEKKQAAADGIFLPESEASELASFVSGSTGDSESKKDKLKSKDTHDKLEDVNLLDAF